MLVTPTPMPFLPPLHYFLSPRSQLVHAQAVDTDDDGVEETLLLYRDSDRVDAFIRGLIAEPPTPQTPTPTPSDDAIALPDVYWLGTGAAVELFQKSWDGLSVQDINGDGKSEILLQGHWDDETSAVHVFQWDGQRYNTLLSFRARGELSVSSSGGQTVFESLERSFPRSSIITRGSARWIDGRYQVLHDTTWEADALREATYPEAALLHTYEAFAQGDAATARLWWSDDLRAQVDEETLVERLMRMPSLRLERLELLEETESAAEAAVTLRWTDPASGSIERSGSEYWELIRQAEGWRLHRLNNTPREAEWRTFTTDDGLSDDLVRDLLLDDTGRLWIAGGDQGLTLWDGQYWIELHQQPDGLASDSVRELHLDPLNRFWFGTSAGITFYDGARWITYTTADGLPGDEVNAIASDAEGNVWAGTTHGAASFDGETWIPLDMPEELAAMEVSAVAVEQEGALWLGLAAPRTGAVLLARLEDDDWERFGTQDGLVGQRISALHTAPDGTLLAAIAGAPGMGGGLAMWTGEQWRVQTAFDGLSGASVYDISVDSAGGIWLATSLGAAYGFGPSWQALTATHGLASDTVYSVLATPGGEVYFGTADGLTRFRDAVARQVIGGGQ
jgi:hypothetical protein